MKKTIYPAPLECPDCMVEDKGKIYAKRKKPDTLSVSLRCGVYWLPRILSILITAFWVAYVFASHGLSANSLIESGVWVILLLLTVLAWQEKLVGKLGFILLGLIYTFAVWNKAPSKLAILGVAGPLLLIGILFLFSKKEYNFTQPKVKKITSPEKQEDPAELDDRAELDDDKII